MRTRLRLALPFLLLAACGGDGPLAPGPFSLEGRWVGRGFPYELALDLRQDGENRVSGTGEVRGLRERLQLDTLELDPLVVDTVRVDTLAADTVRFQVAGRWEFPSFRLRFFSPGAAEAEYAAGYPTVDGRTLPDSLAGTLTGSGFTSAAIPLGRIR
jgi:hypothetical protein